jgi:hypothetical protein
MYSMHYQSIACVVYVVDQSKYIIDRLLVDAPLAENIPPLIVMQPLLHITCDECSCYTYY